VPDSDLVCSFCGKGQAEVRRLVKGPDVAICDGCGHLALAERASADLPVDRYGNLVRDGIAALRDRLSTSD
jgi:ClpX C4-type zinc finger